MSPKYPGVKPDYIIDSGGLDVAFEVKRPESVNSMIDAADRAAGQLRSFGKPGVVCIDLTDCLATLEERVEAARERRLLAVERHDEFFRLARLLEQRPIKYNQSDKYQRVIGLLSFARITEWEFRPEPRASGQTFVLPSMYPTACSGLLAHELPRVQRTLLSAIQDVTGSVPRLAS